MQYNCQIMFEYKHFYYLFFSWFFHKNCSIFVLYLRFYGAGPYPPDGDILIGKMKLQCIKGTGSVVYMKNILSCLSCPDILKLSLSL